jgi:hypothetical protein
LARVKNSVSQDILLPPAQCHVELNTTRTNDGGRRKTDNKGLEINAMIVMKEPFNTN